MIQFLLLFHPWDLISPSLLRPSFKNKILKATGGLRGLLTLVDMNSASFDECIFIILF